MTIEEMQTQLLDAQNSLKEANARAKALEEKNKELSSANERLMEHNNKLFMRLSTPEETGNDTDEKELTEDEVIDEIVGIALKKED